MARVLGEIVEMESWSMPFLSVGGWLQEGEGMHMASHSR